MTTCRSTPPVVLLAVLLASAELASSQLLRSEDPEEILVPIAEAAESGSGSWRFERVRAPRGASESRVNAVAARAGRVAVGDATGVALSIDGGSYERILRSEPVNDLDFAADDSLWVATEDGLQHLTTDARVRRPSTGTGELARSALRVRSAPGMVALGSRGGLFLSPDGERFSARVAALPNAPVNALALRGDPVAPAEVSESARFEIWAVCGGFPWRILVQTGDASVRTVAAERVSIPGRPGGTEPVDLALGLPGAEIVVVFPQALALADSAAGPWRIVRPAVPPGAVLRRVGWFGERAWLATDRGVLEAEALDAPYHRSAAPAGSAESTAFGFGSGSLFVASELGLLEGRREVRVPEVTAAPLRSRERAARLRSVGSQPAIGAVHRAALHYLGLGPERVRALRKGLDRRGWLPELSVSFDYGINRDDRQNWDQTFVSGDTRRLYDYQRDRQRDLSAGVELSWDLGDTLYHPDSIELSRELRQRISLRDDALDEINQLYFEWRSVLVRLNAQIAALDPSEADRLWLRSQELRAGLDGWTGGWFSRALAEVSR